MAKVGAESVEELPKAIVRRLVKEKLSESDAGDLQIHKEAILAFGESARIFIHYLSATAKDVCKESKRQTINAEDIFEALEEIEFQEFIEPLKASLDDFKRKNAGKKAGAAKAKEADKKRKMAQSEGGKEPSTAKAKEMEADKKRKMVQPEVEEEPSAHSEDQEDDEEADEEGNEKEDEEEADEDEQEEEADEDGDNKEEGDINDKEDEEEADEEDNSESA
ncbi:hypothetical protein C5167_046849 [Papaver somniferum]|uniref:Transcription factor CBF/NF-Y/archaeal histone domain-containing protein n=1 Tax=Papaver somniferum TaxID=3469 RepID=A0A4Y7LHS1_PAPSO|nr:DNA polymerase epsilon subunit 3-like [Papaver somniferum]RZC84068.1 hypothetical protein C5167_046849 [Papaver somniferum]